MYCGVGAKVECSKNPSLFYILAPPSKKTLNITRTFHVVPHYSPRTNTETLTVGKRAVGILLECCLVSYNFHFILGGKNLYPHDVMLDGDRRSSSSGTSEYLILLGY